MRSLPPGLSERLMFEKNSYFLFEGLMRPKSCSLPLRSRWRRTNSLDDTGLHDWWALTAGAVNWTKIGTKKTIDVYCRCTTIRRS
jgi:hypothetical protein